LLHAPTSASAPADARIRRSLEDAIVPTLLRFAAPNLGQAALQGGVAVLQIYFLSYLGTDALAGVSLVFPLLTLMFLVAGVAIGGGVAASVARALGAGQRAEAEAVAGQAIAFALVAGVSLGALLICFGAPIYRMLGGEGAALHAAIIYSDIVFGGAVASWLANALTSVVRGTGDMVTLARIALKRLLISVPLSCC
jgi:Na+-driven multidrug efflux pump